MEGETENIRYCTSSSVKNHEDVTHVSDRQNEIEITKTGHELIERRIEFTEDQLRCEEDAVSIKAKMSSVKANSPLKSTTTEFVNSYENDNQNDGSMTLNGTVKTKIQQESKNLLSESVSNEDDRYEYENKSTTISILSDAKCMDEQENDFKIENESKSQPTDLINNEDESKYEKEESTMSLLSSVKSMRGQERNVQTESKSQLTDLINHDDESKYEKEENTMSLLSDAKSSYDQESNVKVQTESKSQITELCNSDDESEDSEPNNEPTPNIEATRDEIQCPVDLLEESYNRKFKWPNVLRSALPILGNDEDSLKWVVENKKVLIRNISWNLCARPPPPMESLKSSPMFSSNIFHLYIIGTEECERSIAQSAINTSKKLWENYLINLLGPSYIPLRSHTLQAIHMIIFAHQSIAHLITDINSTAIATGLNNTLGNKGAVSIHMKILNTSFLFTNAHLAAGQKSVTRRNENFDLINTMTPKKLYRKSRRKFSVTSPSPDNRTLNNSRSGRESKMDSNVADSPNVNNRSRSISTSQNNRSMADELNDSNCADAPPSSLNEYAGNKILSYHLLLCLF